MNKKVIITGDCHGAVASRLETIKSEYININPSNMMIIIAGDVSLNYYLNKTDKKAKSKVNEYGYLVYGVRGNHEERPENIDTYHLVYDENVCGEVYVEDEFPNIRFFTDGGNYIINGYSVLTIGGAYSIDKWYRLNRHGIFNENDPEYPSSKKTGWFPDECLTSEEMENILNNNKGKYFDFIITHTSPESWEPTDLFLNFVDQSKVDKSMEKFLEKVKNEINYNIWIFGHYHANRIERPHVEQFYHYFDEMECIKARWNKYDKTGELDMWIQKNPKFYEEV